MVKNALTAFPHDNLLLGPEFAKIATVFAHLLHKCIKRGVVRIVNSISAELRDNTASAHFPVIDQFSGEWIQEHKVHHVRGFFDIEKAGKQRFGTFVPRQHLPGEIQ